MELNPIKIVFGLLISALLLFSIMLVLSMFYGENFEANHEWQKDFETTTKPGNIYERFITDESLFPFNYDTIRIKSTSISDIISDKTLNNKLSVQELKSYFKEKSSRNNVNLCLWDEEMVFESILSFNNLSKIDFSIIMNLLPNAERLNQLKVDTVRTESNNNIEHLEACRVIDRIYGYNELDNHIQLLLVGHGDLYPTIQIITVTKEEFKYVDDEIMYVFKLENEEEFRIKGCLSVDFREIKIKEIQSTKNTGYDTIEYTYTINDFGEIDKLRK